ncbi:hypothetical protein A3Q56_08265, partial [Intoshia linei]
MSQDNSTNKKRPYQDDLIEKEKRKLHSIAEQKRRDTINVMQYIVCGIIKLKEIIYTLNKYEHVKSSRTPCKTKINVLSVSLEKIEKMELMRNKLKRDANKYCKDLNTLILMFDCRKKLNIRNKTKKAEIVSMNIIFKYFEEMLDILMDYNNKYMDTYDFQTCLYKITYIIEQLCVDG